MSSTEATLQVDWLGLCRRATRRLGEELAALDGIEERTAQTGTRGAGGDDTLELDRMAEEIVFAELAAVHAAGAEFVAFSEERGAEDFGGSSVRVVIDPIDGSTNASREALHYSLSLAVADGPAMEDVAFGFVHDFGTGEQFWARRGEGAWRIGPPGAVHGARPEGERLDPSAGDRRSRDGRLELVGIEASDPRRIRGVVEDLVGACYRVRALGTIAVTLCQVAAARYDGMITLRRCRGVDAAAGQLIVREAGGLVAFPECASPLAATLDATASSRLVAARSPEGLDVLTGVGA